MSKRRCAKAGADADLVGTSLSILNAVNRAAAEQMMPINNSKQLTGLQRSRSANNALSVSINIDSYRASRPLPIARARKGSTERLHWR